jgi:hypothetical protein
MVAFSGQTPDTQIGWLDRTGTWRGTLALPAGKWGRPVLSPDDRYAVIPNGNDLWRVDLARSVSVRLTSNDAENTLPVWSPDGTQIAFTMRRGGREQIHIMNSDGSGESRALPTTDDLFKSPEAWTRQGLVFMNIGAETFRDLWLAPFPEGAPSPLIRTRFGEWQSRVSPDGHWIAYLSNEAGIDDVYIQSFPVPGHKLRVSSAGAGRVWWMPGSDEVCYRTVGVSGTVMMSVKLTRHGEGLEVVESRVLFPFPPEIVGTDLSHDGQRVLVNFTGSGAQQRMLRVILNWTTLVKR